LIAIMSEHKATPRRQAVTTTHAAWGAGHPRILATSEHERYVHEISCDLIHIGSAADSDLKLPATDPLHAKILHDTTDEYVLTMFGEGATGLLPRAPGVVAHPLRRQATRRDRRPRPGPGSRPVRPQRRDG
jgi:hypothetical protein